MHLKHAQDNDMPYDLRPAGDGGYVIDGYVYQLSQAVEHTPAEGGWYGLLRGGLDASATAALDMGMTPDEQQFLATCAGAIIADYLCGQTWRQIRCKSQPALGGLPANRGNVFLLVRCVQLPGSFCCRRYRMVNWPYCRKWSSKAIASWRSSRSITAKLTASQ